MKIDKAKNGYVVTVFDENFNDDKYVFLTWSELVSWLEQNPLS